MVLWGTNPVWNMAGGGATYSLQVAKRKSGMKVIVVDPYFTPTAQALADEWVPVRPGTDAALMEAIAYEMIVNNWQDQDFLDRCCVGFDSEHMPADAKTNENFKDYILGAYDGQPKTAEYASKICGTPVDTIKSLAEQIATTKPASLRFGLAPTRTAYGQRSAHMFYTMGWMSGNFGIPGGEVTGGLAGSPSAIWGAGKPMVVYGAVGYPFPPNNICTEPRGNNAISAGAYKPEMEVGIVYAEVFKAIVEGEYSLPGPEHKKVPCDIRVIYRDNSFNVANQFTGAEYVEQAYRKVDFVCVNDLMFTTDAQLADIVLPVKSNLEYEICGSELNWTDFLMIGSKVIEPYFEAKSDFEILYMIADKLGIDEATLPRMSSNQMELKRLSGTMVSLPDGSAMEPLLTLTQEDIDKFGVDLPPQEGQVTLSELMEKGAYRFERKQDDAFMVGSAAEAYRKDPASLPVVTPSTKFEIYSQNFKDYYDRVCLNDIDPLPKYKACVDGYEQTLSEPEYPFQMITLHHIRHSHSTFSNCKQVNELFANDLLMSSYDAQELGLQRGDWVQVSSKTGKIARKLNPIPNLMPGVVVIGQGNWRRTDAETGVDIGGNCNTLTRSLLVGEGHQAYNSVLVKVEKWTGKELQPDYLTPSSAPSFE